MAATPRTPKASDPILPHASKREAGSSEGMQVPPQEKQLPGNRKTPLDPIDPGLALPHERDQSTAMTPTQPDPKVRQAGRDLKRGLQDTDKSLPMDQTYRKLKR